MHSRNNMLVDAWDLLNQKDIKIAVNYAEVLRDQAPYLNQPSESCYVVQDTFFVLDTSLLINQCHYLVLESPQGLESFKSLGKPKTPWGKIGPKLRRKFKKKGSRVLYSFGEKTFRVSVLALLQNGQWRIIARTIAIRVYSHYKKTTSIEDPTPIAIRSNGSIPLILCASQHQELQQTEVQHQELQQPEAQLELEQSGMLELYQYDFQPHPMFQPQQQQHDTLLELPPQLEYHNGE